MVTEHPLLLDRAEHDIGYRATILDDIAAVPRIDDRLVVLTGPRRVGKSGQIEHRYGLVPHGNVERFPAQGDARLSRRSRRGVYAASRAGHGRFGLFLTKPDTDVSIAVETLVTMTGRTCPLALKPINTVLVGGRLGPRPRPEPVWRPVPGLGVAW